MQAKGEVGLYAKDNPYGYRLNIRHPAVKPLYDMYKAANRLSPLFPTDDADRKEFEGMLLRLLEAGAFERTRALVRREKEQQEKETQKKDAVRVVGRPSHSVPQENII